MESAIHALFFVAILFTVLGYCIDVFNNEVIKQSTFHAVRSANQNSLLQYKEKMEIGEEITSEKMLEQWIENYCLATTNKVENVIVDFIKYDSNPPFYLVKIRGYNKYLKLSETLYGEVISGSVLLNK